MSWITIVWSMESAACLVLALVHLLIWSRQRAALANLFFALTALSIAGIAAFEFLMMRAQTPAEFGALGRWWHIPIFSGAVAIVGFIQVYLRSGRPWFAWSVVGLRVLVLLINFLSPTNINYRAISTLSHPTFLGETISVGHGVANPWSRLAELTILSLVVFVLDASIALWRRGKPEERRRAARIGGSITVFLFLALGQAMMVRLGLLQSPYLVSFPFLIVVAAMGYELSRDLLRVAHLANELRESERRMDLAAHAAGLGLWTWDVIRDEIWITEEGRALFGWRQSEPVNFEGFVARLHPDDREAARQAVQRALNHPGVYDAEYRVQLADGTTRWISGRGQVEFNGKGQALRLRGVAIDISARKQAEEKFRLVVEASPNGIVLVNREGRIVLVNAATEKLFGYTRAELIGQTVELLVPERFRGSHRGDRVGFLAAPKARAMGVGRDLFALRKDGTEFPVEIGLGPIHGAEEVLVLTAIVDITARKQAEAEALRQRAELAHVARVSTMGELAASVAHELNQPLGAILANADAADLFLGQNPPAIDELRAILADIRKDDERAGDVIRRMRALLRKRELERRPLEFSSLVEDVLQMVSGDAALRRITLCADLAPALPGILGDRVHLQQVLLNLILNAMDAMANQPREKRRLLVRTSRAAEDTVELAVTDFGEGIELDKLERVFEPFYTTKPNGMGMGLSIARRIIEAHHGRIWAENNPGGGATFRFALPIEDKRMPG